MFFGSERALVTSSPLCALYYRLYGAARLGDKIRAWHVLPQVCARLHPQAHLLDAGGGMGFYSLYLARHFPEARIQAVDIDKHHLESLSAMVNWLHLQNLAVKQCSLTQLDLEQQFDCVLCVDVLEHIEQDDKAIEQIARALKPGGTFVAHVPQSDQRHYLPQPGDFHIWDHVREGYSQSQFLHRLNQAGLNVILHRNTFGALGAWAADADEYVQHIKPLWLVLMPLLVLFARLDTFMPNTRGNGLLAVAQKPAQKDE